MDSVEDLRLEVERLRQWKAEATEVILGLQDLGKALRLSPGLSITGRTAAEAAERWVARAEKAEAECRDLCQSDGDVRARLADAENALARVRALSDQWERGIPEGPAAIHFCPEGCGDIWETEPTCGHESGYQAAARDLRAALDGKP